MTEGIFERIRQECRLVAEQAESVTIGASAIPGYAALIPAINPGRPQMDPSIHHLGHDGETVAYFCILDAVNFGSGFFPSIFGDIRRSGYRHLAAALSAWFASHGPLQPRDLHGIGPQMCREVFDLPAGNNAADELARLFARSLSDFGNFVHSRFEGNFCSVVESAENSAEGLVTLLAQTPAFTDSSIYRGRRVDFLKRAQLLAIDLTIAFDGTDWGRFTDLDHLTICADNLVPHVLRHDGILTYQKALADRIDRGEPIPAGSPEELEIRACTIHAAELILEEMKRQGHPTTAMMLDNILWHRGQEQKYRQRPRHLTKTTSY